jgi:hypothetical protein
MPIIHFILLLPLLSKLLFFFATVLNTAASILPAALMFGVSSVIGAIQYLSK